jgi:uncharacterized protein YihD (DUF1040 family)
MCSKKHISKVSLIPKGKKDYEDEWKIRIKKAWCKTAQE